MQGNRSEIASEIESDIIATKTAIKGMLDMNDDPDVTPGCKRRLREIRDKLILSFDALVDGDIETGERLRIEALSLGLIEPHPNGEKPNGERT